MPQCKFTQRDLVDLPLLEEFRHEYERRHAPTIETTLEKALKRPAAKRSSGR